MSKEVLYNLVDVEKVVEEENKQKLMILKRVNLKIEEKESIAIVGPSGAGKTTLLNIMGGLDVPTSGKVEFCGKDLHSLSFKEKAKIRNRSMGFVFQFHHLLPEFSVIENIAMPAIISGMDSLKAMDMAQKVLELVDFKHKAHQSVTTLSGGEKQFVAVARAVVMDPLVILADEPTGNLDIKNAHLITELLLKFNREKGTTLVVVTHNLELASKMKRRVKIYDGTIQMD